MKARRIVGALLAILLLGSVAVYAQRGEPPATKPGGAADVRNATPPDRVPPAPSDMRPGGLPPERMAGPPGPQESLPLMPDPESLRRAGATEQQVQTLEDFMFDQQVKRIDLRAAAEKAKLALERLLRASAPDEKAVMAAVDAVNQAHGEMLKQDITAALKVRQVLGEDITRKLQPQRRPDRGDRRGQGPGREGQDQNPPPPRDAGDRPAPPQE